jgi:hypothetical protein
MSRSEAVATSQVAVTRDNARHLDTNRGRSDYPGGKLVVFAALILVAMHGRRRVAD